MKSLSLFCCLLAVIFVSCQKTTSTPSIVGTWAISGISGVYTYQATPSSYMSTTTYAYASPVMTETDSVNGSVTTTQVTVTNEIWVFNNDGTYRINENYEADTSSVGPTVNTFTGWWDYTGSTAANSTIVLRESATPTITPTGGSFYITSVSSTQLVLTVNESNTSSSGASVSKNITLTFTHP